MTINYGNKKIKGVYWGSGNNTLTRIRRIYKGSDLVYTRPTITAASYTKGTITGTNFWKGTVTGIAGTVTGQIVYNEKYLKGVWDFYVDTNRQRNTRNVTLTINAIYEDNTKEQVFFKDDFPNPNGDNVTKWNFKVLIPKDWIGYEVIATSGRTDGDYKFFNVGIINVKRMELDQPI